MKKLDTIQEKFWKSNFGDNYADRFSSTKKIEEFYRAHFGTSRSKINKSFLKKLRANSTLEVGCNLGNQLVLLQKQGFKNLYGVEINPRTVEMAKKNSRNINIIQGSALDIPFKDNCFDLVFTSGLLIHIHPRDLKHTMKEIHRVSKKYIWGFEFFDSRPKAIVYRGHKNRLWKRDFAKMYLNLFPELTLVRREEYQHKNEGGIDSMFLLKKK